MSQPLTDSVLSRLEADLEPWPRLLVIADRLEELGEDRLAWGYRWLAEHRKWPVLKNGFWTWPGYGNGKWGEPSHCLHFQPAQWLKGRPDVVGRQWFEFDSMPDALRAAAEAVAMTLYPYKETPFR
jgi:hypothetical protein